jgi:hypothetical protein
LDFGKVKCRAKGTKAAKERKFLPFVSSRPLSDNSFPVDFVEFFTNFNFVFARIGKIFVIIALVAMLGAHWALLQTVAWTTMLAKNLHSSSFHDAVTKTFDGQHPCPLCKAIAAGKKSEQKTEFSLQSQKLEFPPAKDNFVLIAPSQFQLLPLENSSAKSLAQKPLLQPPRGFFV